MHKVWLGTSSVVLAAIMTATSVGASATQVFAAENELLLDTAEEETAEEDLVVDFEEVQDTTEEDTAEEGEEVFLEDSDELDGESVDDESAELEETGTASKKGYSKVKNLVGTDFELGAASFDIMYGSNIVTKDGVDYYALPDGIYSCAHGEESLILKVKDAENLNVLDGKVFFTTYKDNKAVLNVFDLETAEYEKTLEIGDEWINQMYAVNDGSCLLLIEGTIYKLNLNTYSMIRYIDETDVFNFTPTKYGIVFAKGSSCNYTVYFNNVKILSDVENYYVDGENLIISNDGEDYEISMSDVYYSKKDKFENKIMSLNETDTVVKSNVSDEVAAQVQIYDKTALILPEEETAIIFEDSLNNTPEANTISEQDFIDILNGVDDGISNGNTDYDNTAEYIVEPAANNEINTKTSSREVSDLTKAMVKRAEEVYGKTWTPLKDVKGYVGQSENKGCPAGVEIHGIPYGQPIGYYALFNEYEPGKVMTLDYFLSKAKTDPDFELYDPTIRVHNSQKWTLDCSAFVSYCWGIDRHSTGTIPGVSKKILDLGSLDESYKNIHIGDALNKAGTHVVLVTEVKRNAEGKITSVTTIEQTPPHTEKKVFDNLAVLKSTHGGYSIYRYNEAVIDENEECITLGKAVYPMYLKQSEKMTVNLSDGLSGVTYRSNNTKVATVSKTGEIKAVAVGNTSIVVTAYDSHKEPYIVLADVIVSNPYIKVAPKEIKTDFYTGQEKDLDITFEPGGTITCKSNKPSIVKVNNAGKIEAVSHGTAIITITGKTKEGITKTAKCVVTVKQPYIKASALHLGPDFYKGQDTDLTASVVPDTDSVKWTSDNNKVVTVKDGHVTAAGVGKATITVTGKTKKGKAAKPCKISVIVSKADVKITPATVPAGFYIGQTKQLTAIVEPNKNTDISWKSSNVKVVKVSEDGLLTAVGAGSATITATGKGPDGKNVSNSKPCVVTVKKPSVKLKPSTINSGFYVGEKRQLTAEFTPNGTVTNWSSSNSGIVSVNKFGEITANKTGTAIITVSSESNGYKLPAVQCKVKVVYPTVKISPAKVPAGFYIGQTKQLKAVYSTSDGDVDAWKSANEKIVHVDEKTGEMTAKGAGTTKVTLTAHANGCPVKAECTVTVIKPSAKISPSAINTGFYIGQKRTLSAEITPNGTVTNWSSSNPGVVSVNHSGEITANATGTAIITMSSESNGYKIPAVQCKVTVKYPTATVSPAKVPDGFFIGQTKQLKAVFTPEGVVEEWKSDNTAVVTVSETGVIKGIKEGSTKVTVKGRINGCPVSASCTVTVKKPSVKISPSGINTGFYKGQQRQLTANFTPNGTVTNWSSSNSGIVAVNKSGVITATGAGTATITVVGDSNGCRVTARCNVTVNEPSVQISNVPSPFYTGQTRQLNANFTPNGTVTSWSSSNNSVVSVTSSGVIKAESAGSAKITVVGNSNGVTVSRSCTVTVTKPTMSITSYPSTLYKGQTYQLGVRFTPSGTVTSWSSSNPGIVSVNKSGVVTANSTGTATITAVGNSNGQRVTAQCTITVKAKTLTATCSKTTIKKGQTTKINASTSPSAKITFSSQDTRIATVDQNGIVTAKGVGTVKIYVMANGLTKTITIKVTL